MGEENVPRGLLETCNFIGCPCCMMNPMTRAMERLGLNCEGLMPASTSPALGAGPPPQLPGTLRVVPVCSVPCTEARRSLLLGTCHQWSSHTSPTTTTSRAGEILQGH